MAQKPLNLHLMRDIEHWRWSGFVQNQIDQTEKHVGYESGDYVEYDPEIDSLRLAVEREIESLGHSVTWVGQQSRGVGHVLQDTDDERRTVFETALGAASLEFMKDCIRECEELKKLSQEE